MASKHAANLKVYGASYSVYSRILRFALIEKNVEYDWIETDIFDDADGRAEQIKRHPFGKIPSLDHDRFALYETNACLSYLEQPCFGPVRLIPEDPRLRARADQIAGIADAYGYRTMVWETYIELRNSAQGKPYDQSVVERGLAALAKVLDTIERLSSDDAANALAGQNVSFADLYLAPVLAYFISTEPGREMLANRKRITAWWEAWTARPSLHATQYPQEE